MTESPVPPGEPREDDEPAPAPPDDEYEPV